MARELCPVTLGQMAQTVFSLKETIILSTLTLSYSSDYSLWSSSQCQYFLSAGTQVGCSVIHKINASLLAVPSLKEINQNTLCEVQAGWKCQVRLTSS